MRNVMAAAQRVVALACAALAASLSFAHQGPHDAKSTAAQVQPGYVRTLARYETPDAKLIDMHGAAFELRASLETDTPVMVNFVFTSCAAICPVMSATFSQVQKKLAPQRDKLRLISISIDPEYDTPSRLREYAQKFGAGPQWQFVTGSADASIEVQRAFGVYRGDKMSHDPVTLMRVARGAPWVRLEGFASANDLIREYRRLRAQ